MKKYLLSILFFFSTLVFAQTNYSFSGITVTGRKSVRNISIKGNWTSKKKELEKNGYSCSITPGWYRCLKNSKSLDIETTKSIISKLKIKHSDDHLSFDREKYIEQTNDSNALKSYLVKQKYYGNIAGVEIEGNEFRILQNIDLETGEIELTRRVLSNTLSGDEYWPIVRNKELVFLNTLSKNLKGMGGYDKYIVEIKLAQRNE